MENSIKFLKKYLAKLQATYATASELTESDFVPRDTTEVPETSPKDERVARLADDHNMDGSLFRYVHSHVFDLNADLRHARLQIETIPRIIAAIEKAEQQAQSEPTPPLPKQVPRKRGRKRLTQPRAARRNRILKAWARAKAEGTVCKDFCDDKNITPRKLDNYRRWARQIEERARQDARTN